MKNILLFMAILSVASTLSAQQKKTAIAVTEFSASGGLTQTETATLTNRFRGMLVRTGAFDVLEREKMNEVLKSQDFNLSENCNSAECAVQVGQLLGVERMIAGDIGKLGKTFTIDLRLIDIQSGKIIKTETRDYEGAIDGLLGVMSSIAQSFAGQGNTASMQTEKMSQAAAPSGSNKTLWYVLGGVAAAGAGAAVLLGGAKAAKAKADTGIPDPAFPQ